MSSSLSPDEEAGFARFEEDGPSTVAAAAGTATAAHPSVVNLHPHPHHHAAAATAAAPSSPVAASPFGSDPITSTLGVSLASLNAAPASHTAALQQLELAKLYIARSQTWHAAKRARFASRSNSKLGNAKSFNKATGTAPSAAGAGFAREDSLLPYGSADEWEDGSDYTDDDGSDDGAMEMESSPTMDDRDLQAHLHGGVPEMSPDDYYAMPWYKLLAKRLPWLVVLLLLQSFGALIMNHYDDLLSKHLVLNFFIPMMQGTSGNAGNQPGVMVTRALSLGKLRLAELLSKELPVAILMAFTLGVVAYFRIRLVYPDDVGSAESIGIALFCSVILAVSLSIVFSILLSHITCCDPADGAVPLLSTVSDVISILLLVIIASHILPYPNDQ